MTEQPTTNITDDQVTLVDLHNVLQIIDTCSKRGAFEGSELTSVGQLRNKIANFLQAASVSAEEASKTSNEEAEVKKPTRKAAKTKAAK